MDDYFDCLASQQLAIETVYKEIKILSSTRFRFTKWLPNKRIWKTLSSAEKPPKVFNLDLNVVPIERALTVPTGRRSADRSNQNRVNKVNKN